MARHQMIFGDFFSGTFGPRGDFEPRDWQLEATHKYDQAVREWNDQGKPEVQHRFTVYAGTGSGKTKFAGMAAAYQLSAKRIGQVVFVCPNRSIKRKTREEFSRHFGVELDYFHKAKHANGVGRNRQGYILTYGHLLSDPTLHRRICSMDETLVIFDEVHHLGDQQGWGDSALEAYGTVPYIISLTGTPYRSDNTRIPFVGYEQTGTEGIVRFRADYAYNLGRAVVDGVCRKPVFHFSSDGEVNIRRVAEGPYEVVTFKDQVDEETARLRLRGAVHHASATRRKMLAEALKLCRESRRKVIVFLGGDTEGNQTPTEDATTLLPPLLNELGVSDDEFDVVTGDDKDSLQKIEQFGRSNKWILVSINMVSEGTDIPELSAAIFLTSITAKQTTIQRIGRALRRMGEEDPISDAWIFMFQDQRLYDLRLELEAEVEFEEKLAKERDGQAEAAGRPSERKQQAEAIGVSGGEITEVCCHGHAFPIDRLEPVRQELRAKGLPATYAMAALVIITREGLDAA